MLIHPEVSSSLKRYGSDVESKFTNEEGRAAFLDPVQLPCGAIIANRIAKAPMSEERADAQGRPNRNLIEMHRAWGNGGFGLNITGNFVIDKRWLVAPGNVVCESERDLEGLRMWSSAAQANGTPCWVQICHPGRQTSSPDPVAPSAVSLPWGPPVRALTEEEIHEIIDRFVTTARVVKDAGFSGVQIHCAHGYLLSQFLSPLVNQRKDQWGGASLENRARISLEIVRKTREIVGPTFPIGVKINSADFQRGGFDEEEAYSFVKMLERESVDLIEVSGGTYEKLAMTDGEDGREEKQSTKEREAYFLEFSKRLVESTSIPIMCTGGWRSRDAMISALKNKDVHLVGLGRPAIEADLPNKLISGKATGALITRYLEGVENFTWCQVQFDRTAMGLAPQPDLDL